MSVAKKKEKDTTFLPLVNLNAEITAIDSSKENKYDESISDTAEVNNNGADVLGGDDQVLENMKPLSTQHVVVFDATNEELNNNKATLQKNVDQSVAERTMKKKQVMNSTSVEISAAYEDQTVPKRAAKKKREINLLLCRCVMLVIHV
jgi:hypothetical protein